MFFCRADLGLGKKVLWRLYSCGKLVLGLPRSRITKGWVDTFYQSATLRLRMAWNASVGLPRQHGVSDLPFGYIFFPLMLAFPSVYLSFFFGFVSEVAENWRFLGSSGETTMQEVLQCVSGIGSV